MSSHSHTRIGLERLGTDLNSWVAGRRVGLVLNHTSYTSEMIHAVEYLRQAGAEVRVLFGPEHGIWGTHQDMEAVGDDDSTDWGLPVYSLYGQHEETLKPRAEWLQGIDVLVFDIQDIGSRYYTYIYTMRYCMVACAEADIEFIVCDRPNPLDGVTIEGNLVQLDFRSFVGDFPLTNRHGLTAGELALLFNRPISCRLRVAELLHWQREMRLDQTGLPWISTSPNMPTLETALVYPGMCLIEGTNLSEGRGTTMPFLQFGAPFVDPFALREAVGELPGLSLRPIRFRPMFQKWAGQVCGGLFLHVTDPAALRSYEAALRLIAGVRSLWPKQFDWRREPYEFVSDRLAIDLLCGDDSVRIGLERGADIAELVSGMQKHRDPFEFVRQSVMIYGESCG